MHLYCYLDSTGTVDTTNLQLFSLKQAARNWNELVEALSERDQDEIEDLKERLVFILSCLGLSLTQLLGQNWPSESKEKMDNPADLLSRILRCSHFDRDKKKILNKTFREFFSFYGAIRHFGKVKNDTS